MNQSYNSFGSVPVSIVSTSTSPSTTSSTATAPAASSSTHTSTYASAAMSTANTTSTTIPSPAHDISSMGPTITVPVFINLYDLHPSNAYFHFIGLGAYHSGVEVGGREYTYGAHGLPSTGVFYHPPRDVAPHAKFREQIPVGTISMPWPKFAAVMSGLRSDFVGRDYDMLNQNCNHFATAMVTRLGLQAPPFINRLARVGQCISCILPEKYKQRPTHEETPLLGGSMKESSNVHIIPKLKPIREGVRSDTNPHTHNHHTQIHTHTHNHLHPQHQHQLERKMVASSYTRPRSLPRSRSHSYCDAQVIITSTHHNINNNSSSGGGGGGGSTVNGNGVIFIQNNNSNSNITINTISNDNKMVSEKMNPTTLVHRKQSAPMYVGVRRTANGLALGGHGLAHSLCEHSLADSNNESRTHPFPDGPPREFLAFSDEGSRYQLPSLPPGVASSPRVIMPPLRSSDYSHNDPDSRSHAHSHSQSQSQSQAHSHSHSQCHAHSHSHSHSQQPAENNPRGSLTLQAIYHPDALIQLRVADIEGESRPSE